MQMTLKHLQRTVGITFVYVTHDQSEALSMSDRVAVVSSGKIEQIGTPREIYAQPTTRFVASFIGRTNFVPVEQRDGQWVALDRPVFRNAVQLNRDARRWPYAPRASPSAKTHAARTTAFTQPSPRPSTSETAFA